jgi:hypothetical protein
MGAMATITLPPEPNVHPPVNGKNIILRLTDAATLHPSPFGELVE